jgi:hypothetical protein
VDGGVGAGTGAQGPQGARSEGRRSRRRWIEGWERAAREREGDEEEEEEREMEEVIERLSSPPTPDSVASSSDMAASPTQRRCWWSLAWAKTYAYCSAADAVKAMSWGDRDVRRENEKAEEVEEEVLLLLLRPGVVIGARV